MPRGRKPAPIKKPSSTTILAFAAKVEQATPEWLDGFLERHRVLVERFNERDAEGNYVATVEQQAQIHKTLTTSEAKLMEVAVIKAQIAKEKGVSHFMEREGSTHNHLTLNFAPGMTSEQRAYAERLYLASLSGKEVEALPLHPASVKDAEESAA